MLYLTSGSSNSEAARLSEEMVEDMFLICVYFSWSLYADTQLEKKRRLQFTRYIGIPNVLGTASRIYKKSRQSRTGIFSSLNSGVVGCSGLCSGGTGANLMSSWCLRCIVPCSSVHVIPPSPTSVMILGSGSKIGWNFVWPLFFVRTVSPT